MGSVALGAGWKGDFLSPGLGQLTCELEKEGALVKADGERPDPVSRSDSCAGVCSHAALGGPAASVGAPTAQHHVPRENRMVQAHVSVPAISAALTRGLILRLRMQDVSK